MSNPFNPRDFSMGPADSSLWRSYWQEKAPHLTLEEFQQRCQDECDARSQAAYDSLPPETQEKWRRLGIWP